MERGLLILRHTLNLSVKFRCGSLIYPAGLSETTLTNSLKDAQHTRSIYLCGILRTVEAHLHMALRGEIIDFIGTHLPYHLHYRHGIA